MRNLTVLSFLAIFALVHVFQSFVSAGNANNPSNVTCHVGENLENIITFAPVINIPIGCDVCVEFGDNATLASLFCQPVTTRLSVDCVIKSPEGLTPNELTEIYDGFQVASASRISMFGLLANPEDPAPPRILGDWTCTCNNSDITIISISRLGPCRATTVPVIRKTTPGTHINRSMEDISVNVGEDVHISSGQRATIVCDLEERGYPPAVIHWTRPDHATFYLHHNEIVTSENAVKISYVTEAFEGTYCCIAQNDVGMDEACTKVSLLTPPPLLTATTGCPSGMYNCILTGRCVDIAVLCDGINDCGDTDPGSDEVEAVCMKPYSGIPRYVKVAIGLSDTVRFPVNVMVYLDCQQFAQLLFGSNLNKSLVLFMWSIQWVHGNRIFFIDIPEYGEQVYIIDRIRIADDAEYSTEASYTCEVCSITELEANCSTATTHIMAFDPPNVACHVGENYITFTPVINIPIGCDVCVEFGDNATHASLFCQPVTTRLPVDCVIRSPEGLTPNELADIYDVFQVASVSQITMFGLLANPEDPAPPRILGDWACTCSNSDGIATSISRLGPCLDYIRLSENSTNSNEGTVEVFFEGVWVKICEESWDKQVAEVVCNQLGYPRALSATTSGYIEGGDGVACLFGIRCRGNEKELRECQQKNWKHTIPSKQYAAVICQLQVLPMTSDDQVVFSLIGLLVFALLIIILSVTLVFVRWQHKKKLRAGKLKRFELRDRNKNFYSALLVELDEDWVFSRDDVTILRNIGCGNFGEVQLALIPHDIKNTRAQKHFRMSEKDNSALSSNLVVVKRLKGTYSIEEQMAFVKEFRIMQRACSGDCPNIVHILGCIRGEDLAIVLEYIPLGDLQSMLKKWKELKKSISEENDSLKKEPSLAVEDDNEIDPGENLYISHRPDIHCGKDNTDLYYQTLSIDNDDLISFAYQIASGMEYLSGLDIIHRDLACRNVLVAYDKLLKITDFGLSRESEGAYASTSTIGMPIRWLAPECLTEKQYSEKSDVWSFGICLWEICTFGQKPYPDFSNRDVLIKIPEGYKMEKPKGCSDTAYKTMCNCWEMDLEERQTFAEIKQNFERLIAEKQEVNYLDLNVILSDQTCATERSLDKPSDEETPSATGEVAICFAAEYPEIEPTNVSNV